MTQNVKRRTPNVGQRGDERAAQWWALEFATLAFSVPPNNLLQRLSCLSNSAVALPQCAYTAKQEVGALCGPKQSTFEVC